MTKSPVSCRFGHIYWGNPEWKTAFFVQCQKLPGRHLNVICMLNSRRVSRGKSVSLEITYRNAFKNWWNFYCGEYKHWKRNCISKLPYSKVKFIKKHPLERSFAKSQKDCYSSIFRSNCSQLFYRIAVLKKSQTSCSLTLKTTGFQLCLKKEFITGVLLRMLQSFSK